MQEHKSHNTSIDHLMAKQRSWLKSSIIDGDDKYNQYFSSFSFFNKKFKSENYIANTFPDIFSFYPHSLDIKKHFKKLEEIMLRASSDPFSTIVMSNVLQTLFSLYLHNQYTDFHKLSCARKPQMRAICTYMGCTKATTNDWDIGPSVAIKALSANILWIAK